jgi:hypothetical protein
MFHGLVNLSSSHLVMSAQRTREYKDALRWKIVEQVTRIYAKSFMRLQICPAAVWS